MGLRTGHHPSLYRDLEVVGSALEIGTLTDLLRTGTFENWARDTSAEDEYRQLVGDAAVDCLVFVYAGPELPKAALFLDRSEGGFAVPTVVPRASNQLSHGEYNALLSSFSDDCLLPCIEQVGGSLAVKFGPTEEALEDMLSPRAIDALRRFSVCANPSTGKGHPLDARRWNDFVRLAHEDGCDLRQGFLREWLLAEGWSERHASNLADSYWDQIDILRHASPTLRIAGRPSDWAAELLMLRSSVAVVVADTCSLNDVLRFGVRVDRTDAARTLSAIRELVGFARRTPAVVSFAAPSSTADERRQTGESAQEEVARSLQQSELLMQRLVACSPSNGDDAQDKMRDILAAMRGAVEATTALYDELMHLCWDLPVTEEAGQAAYSRSARGQAPASRGKDALIDCSVVECALQLARDLPASRTRVFLLSSNTKDFGLPGLAEELSAKDVTYCRNWEHACYEVSQALLGE